MLYAAANATAHASDVGDHGVSCSVAKHSGSASDASPTVNGGSHSSPATASNLHTGIDQAQASKIAQHDCEFITTCMYLLCPCNS